jgi:hypothetical protein
MFTVIDHLVASQLNKEDLEAPQTPDFPCVIGDVLDPPPFDHVLRLDQPAKLIHEVIVQTGLFAPQQGRIAEERSNLGRDQRREH